VIKAQNLEISAGSLLLSRQVVFRGDEKPVVPGRVFPLVYSRLQQTHGSAIPVGIAKQESAAFVRKSIFSLSADFLQ
jgi:hypothetical protein